MLVSLLVLFMANINKCIFGFANYENIDILVENIIKLFELLMAMYNYYRKYININKRMVKSRNNNILYDECVNEIGIV